MWRREKPTKCFNILLTAAKYLISLGSFAVNSFSTCPTSLENLIWLYISWLLGLWVFATRGALLHIRLYCWLWEIPALLHSEVSVPSVVLKLLLFQHHSCLMLHHSAHSKLVFQIVLLCRKLLGSSLRWNLRVLQTWWRICAQNQLWIRLIRWPIFQFYQWLCCCEIILSVVALKGLWCDGLRNNVLAFLTPWPQCMLFFLVRNSCALLLIVLLIRNLLGTASSCFHVPFLRPVPQWRLLAMQLDITSMLQMVMA